VGAYAGHLAWLQPVPDRDRLIGLTQAIQVYDQRGSSEIADACRGPSLYAAGDHEDCPVLGPLAPRHKTPCSEERPVSRMARSGGARAKSNCTRATPPVAGRVLALHVNQPASNPRWPRVRAGQTCRVYSYLHTCNREGRHPANSRLPRLTSYLNPRNSARERSASRCRCRYRHANPRDLSARLIWLQSGTALRRHHLRAVQLWDDAAGLFRAVMDEAQCGPRARRQLVPAVFSSMVGWSRTSRGLTHKNFYNLQSLEKGGDPWIRDF
jgi:hypothetical protein